MLAEDFAGARAVQEHNRDNEWKRFLESGARPDRNGSAPRPVPRKTSPAQMKALSRAYGGNP